MPPGSGSLLLSTREDGEHLMLLRPCLACGRERLGRMCSLCEALEVAEIVRDIVKGQPA